MQETELEESVVMDESEIDRTLVRWPIRFSSKTKGARIWRLLAL